MNVGGQVSADGLLGDCNAAGPLFGQRVDVLKSVVAGLDEVLGDGIPGLRIETWGTRRMAAGRFLRGLALSF